MQNCCTPRRLWNVSCLTQGMSTFHYSAWILNYVFNFLNRATVEELRCLVLDLENKVAQSEQEKGDLRQERDATNQQLTDLRFDNEPVLYFYVNYISIFIAGIRESVSCSWMRRTRSNWLKPRNFWVGSYLMPGTEHFIIFGEGVWDDFFCYRATVDELGRVISDLQSKTSQLQQSRDDLQLQKNVTSQELADLRL